MADLHTRIARREAFMSNLRKFDGEKELDDNYKYAPLASAGENFKMAATDLGMFFGGLIFPKGMTPGGNVLEGWATALTMPFHAVKDLGDGILDATVGVAARLGYEIVDGLTPKRPE